MLIITVQLSMIGIVVEDPDGNEVSLFAPLS